MTMLSYIEDHEVEEAKKYVAQQLGVPLPEPRHDYIVVKLFIRPEEVFTIKDASGKEITFYLPEVIRQWDKFRNCAALVISIGEGCEGISYRVGDFIMIPRNEGSQVNYCGYTLHYIPYNKIYGVIADPEQLQRINA